MLCLSKSIIKVFCQNSKAIFTHVGRDFIATALKFPLHENLLVWVQVSSTGAALVSFMWYSSTEASQHPRCFLIECTTNCMELCVCVRHVRVCVCLLNGSRSLGFWFVDFQTSRAVAFLALCQQPLWTLTSLQIHSLFLFIDRKCIDYSINIDADKKNYRIITEYVLVFIAWVLVHMRDQNLGNPYWSQKRVSSTSTMIVWSGCLHKHQLEAHKDFPYNLYGTKLRHPDHRTVSSGFRLASNPRRLKIRPGGHCMGVSAHARHNYPESG